MNKTYRSLSRRAALLNLTLSLVKYVSITIRMSHMHVLWESNKKVFRNSTLLIQICYEVEILVTSTFWRLYASLLLKRNSVVWLFFFSSCYGSYCVLLLLLLSSSSTSSRNRIESQFSGWFRTKPIFCLSVVSRVELNLLYIGHKDKPQQFCNIYYLFMKMNVATNRLMLQSNIKKGCAIALHLNTATFWKQIALQSARALTTTTYIRSTFVCSMCIYIYWYWARPKHYTHDKLNCLRERFFKQLASLPACLPACLMLWLSFEHSNHMRNVWQVAKLQTLCAQWYRSNNKIFTANSASGQVTCPWTDLKHG